jgi:hypothetical protein
MTLRRAIIFGTLWVSGGVASDARGEVVPPLVTYSNPIPMSGERFGRYAYSNGTHAFVSDSDARENGMTGAVYQFDLTTGTLIRTFGSPEGANEVNFGDKDAIATLGDNLLVGDWAARRQISPGGAVSFGGLGYRFSIASGKHLETYSPVGRPNLTGGAYALGICGLGDRVVVGWNIRKALETFDVAGGFLVRYEYLGQPSGFGAPIKPLGPGAVVVGTGGSANAPRTVHVIEVATGAILAALPDPRPTGTAVTSGFGEAVATNAAGTRILVGAMRGNTEPNTGEGWGVAYLYDAAGNLLRAIDAPPGAESFFGFDVDFLVDDLLISAPTNNANTGVVALIDGDTGEVLRLYNGYFFGNQFGYSVGAVDSSRFLVGSLTGEAYLLPAPDPCAGITADGDMDASGTTDGDDIAHFTAAVLAAAITPPDRCRGDFNQNGVVDDPDIPLFVDALLAP